MAEVVLLTGISGFIAKHVAVSLLRDGHTVRGTMRSLAREDEVRSAVAPHLDDPAALDRLSFVAADLTSDAGWNEAMDGITAVVHTASPFPIASPKDPQELIGPAVDGTLRVLRATKTAGITRVVLTSSIAAVVQKAVDPNRLVCDESDWSDPDYAGSTPYTNSKLFAEQAAWKFAKEEGLDLTTVNPGLVYGRPLDVHFGSSVDVVKRMLAGKDPAVPRIGLAIVDVRDIADLHAAALSQSETVGRRLIAAGESRWMSEVAAILKEAYPKRRIATREAPNWMVRLMGIVDGQARSIGPRLGVIDRVDTSPARAVLGRDFRSASEATLASAAFLVEHDLA